MRELLLTKLRVRQIRVLMTQRSPGPARRVSVPSL